MSSEEKVRKLVEVHEPAGEYIQEGYQPRGETPVNPIPPNVGSGVVKPNTSQTQDNGDKSND